MAGAERREGGRGSTKKYRGDKPFMGHKLTRERDDDRDQDRDFARIRVDTDADLDIVWRTLRRAGRFLTMRSPGPHGGFRKFGKGFRLGSFEQVVVTVALEFSFRTELSFESSLVSLELPS